MDVFHPKTNLRAVVNAPLFMLVILQGVANKDHEHLARLGKPKGAMQTWKYPSGQVMASKKRGCLGQPVI